MEKDKVAVFIHGGIGNQLFQIATCKEYAKKYNKEEVYKNVKNLWNYHGLERKTAWNTLFDNNLNVIEIEDYEKIDFNQINEKRLNMYDELEYIEGDVYLKGYFQSAKFFSKETKKEMTELIYSNKELYSIAVNYFNFIKSLFINFNNENDDDYAFIHIRRTDYIDNCTHNLLSMDYYKKGIEIIGKNKLYLIFSDDVKWCYDNLDFIENKYVISINNIYVELILMTFIKNCIIANSTFSWWGSFINNENKKIVAPKQWFAETSHIKEWSDIYTENMILI
jgi:hypothetical protein